MRTYTSDLIGLKSGHLPSSRVCVWGGGAGSEKPNSPPGELSSRDGYMFYEINQPYTV